MKFRDGFVSNSSSSSFVIIGKRIEGSSLKEEMLKRNPQAVQKWLSEQHPNKYYSYKELDDDHDYECYCDIEDKLDIVTADEGIYEGIKIKFDENGYCDQREYDLDDIPKGSKVYTGMEAT